MTHCHLLILIVYKIYISASNGGDTKLVSISSLDILSNDTSVSPNISQDGNFVVFNTLATNLTNVPDNNLNSDVILRNIADNKTILISESTTGETADNYSGNAVISEKANYVAFVSLATNLTSEVDTAAIQDVYVYVRLALVLMPLLPSH